MQKTAKVEEKEAQEYKKLDENYWKEKYFSLMEEHHLLLKKIALLENRNE